MLKEIRMDVQKVLVCPGQGELELAFFGEAYTEEPTQELSSTITNLVFITEDSEGAVVRDLPWENVPDTMRIKLESVLAEIEAYAWRNIIVGGM